MNPESPTVWPHINALLSDWSREAVCALGDKAVGLYLGGSLSYGDFVPARSDIDLQTLVTAPLTALELTAIEALHRRLDREHPTWRGRVECSYDPLERLASILPPAQPRPWWGFDRLYPEADSGNEWLINQHLLWHRGIALYGPPYRSLLPAPDIREVRRASARDFYREWLPKLEDTAYLDDPHQQSYLVLNLCRILCTVCGDGPGSKRAAAKWTCAQYPQWTGLIAEAQSWEYGMEMQRQTEVLAMICFVDSEIKSGGILD